MTEEDKRKLLDAIMADGELAQLRSDSLNRGLAALRRRRQRNAAVRISLAAVPIMVLALVLLHSPNASRETPVKHITAEQLLALFPNRAVALVGAPGHQQLVFLDEVPLRTEPE